MKTTRHMLLAFLAAGFSLTAFAQVDLGPRRDPGFRLNKNNTPGWSMMTKEERAAHHDKMMSLKTYDECKAYYDEHRAQMEARAKEKGKTLPMPRNNACDRMKSRGMIK